MSSSLLHNPRVRLAGLLALAGAIVATAVLALGAKDAQQPAPAPSASASAPAGVAETQALLRGIPQRGAVLGNPRAPVTLVEFSDPQCPFCRDYHQAVLPTIVARYVRSGRVRIAFEPLHFLGPDSTRVAELAAAAAPHGRLWTVVSLGYANQGPENSGWATDPLLDAIATSAGLDRARLTAQGDTLGVLAAAQAAARSHRIDSTPSFLVGRTGGTLRPLVPSALTPDAFTPALDALLRR